MASERPSRPSSASSKQLAAVATAAIPVVMLSALAMAQPAAAVTAPTGPAILPAALTHGGLTAAVANATRSSSIPAALVAGHVPTSISPIQVITPATHTVAPGDTVSAISARYGLSTASVLKLNKLSASSIIYPGQKLRLSGVATAPSLQAAAKPEATGTGKSYVVAAGDTISGIAARNGLSTASVLAANGLNNGSIIYPGQVIKLGGGASNSSSGVSTANTTAPKAATPASSGSGKTYVVAAGDTISGIAARNGVSTASVLASNGLNNGSIIYPGQVIKLGGGASSGSTTAAKAPAAAAPSSAGKKYTIVSGDTLSGIAAKNGVSLSSLQSANGLNNSSIIYAGRTLTIPGLSASSSSITPLPDNQKVGSTFLNYTYPDAVVSEANVNKAALMSAPVPSRSQMKDMVARTAAQMGVDPALALAFAQQESGFDQQAVSPANAIGTMQVIPAAGQWASDLVGRKLNLLNPQDNVTAGVAIIRALLAGAPNEDLAIAGYYQGQYSVSLHGMFPDTKVYVAGVKANRDLFR